MLFKNLNRFAYRFSTAYANTEIQQLRWKLSESGVSIYFDQIHQSSIVFQVMPNMKFNQFVLVNSLDQKQVVYPQKVNPQSDVLTFLLNLNQEYIIQFVYRGRKLILKNKACDQDSRDLLNEIRNKNGIYQDLAHFQQNNHPQSKTQISDYLTRYYLKLQTQYYCRAHKIPLQSKMTPELKQKILAFLKYIVQNMKLAAKISISIDQTSLKINHISSFFLKRLKWYKNLAILITTVHLVGFAYMVFGVDWLGWDITEPLTYTVGVIYTLLGIRFYRKYGVNRSAQSINDTLFKMIMSPAKKAQLKQLTARKQIQLQQLKRIKQQGKILKNKLAYNTVMIRDHRFDWMQ